MRGARDHEVHARLRRFALLGLKRALDAREVEPAVAVGAFARSRRALEHLLRDDIAALLVEVVWRGRRGAQRGSRGEGTRWGGRFAAAITGHILEEAPKTTASALLSPADKAPPGTRHLMRSSVPALLLRCRGREGRCRGKEGGEECARGLKDQGEKEEMSAHHHPSLHGSDTQLAQELETSWPSVPPLDRWSNWSRIGTRSLESRASSGCGRPARLRKSGPVARPAHRPPHLVLFCAPCGLSALPSLASKVPCEQRSPGSGSHSESQPRYGKLDA